MKNLYLLLLFSFLFSCASVQSPQGGPKDSAAPVLIRSNLKNGETGFREKSIVLEFNENVAENDAKQPFLSPVTQATPIVTGRRIKITPDSGWKENQTYELRLNRKIKDEHEGNLATDTSLLFSTGKSADSLIVRVQPQTLSGKTSSGKTTVLLTDERQTKYFSNGEGSQVIRGLAKGKYLAECFQDKNDNLKYEEEDGNLFTDSIQIDSATDIQARLLPQQFKPLRFFHLRRKDTLVIESNRFIRPDTALLGLCKGRNEESTLFSLYPVKRKMIFTHEDSLGTAYRDTIIPEETDSSRSLPVIALKRKTSTRLKKPGIVQISLSWNWQVLRFPEKVECTFDSVWKRAEWEKNPFGLRLQVPLQKAGKLRIRFDSLRFYNRQSITADSVQVQASDLEPAGKISGSIESEAKNLRTELVGQTGPAAINIGSGFFSWQVIPGQYRLQVYIDVNGDGRYTGGNMKKGRKAEPLYVYPEKIELKPGWDLENIKVKPEF